jgi:hypothetical protein
MRIPTKEITMDDIHSVAAAIVEAFGRYGCTVVNRPVPEPMSGGWLCEVELDGMSDGLEADPGVVVAKTQVREGRRWHAVTGVVDGSWNLAFQGEWGILEDGREEGEIVRMQVWAGRLAVPDDVRFAFRLEHDRLIVQGAAIDLAAVAARLSEVSDEALAAVPLDWMLPDLEKQVDRLRR